MNTHPMAGLGQSSLWMGDLEPHMEEEYLKALYDGMGYKVISVRMIRDRVTGKQAGYCFLEFADEVTAQNVLMNLNLKPWPNTNKLLKLNWAVTNKANTQEHSVYVGELSYEIDDHELYKFFAANLSSCKSAKVVCDGNGKSKGFGFVRFNNEEDAKRAIRDFNLSPGLGNRRIRVCKAFPKQGERGGNMASGGQFPGQYPGGGMGDPWQQYQNVSQYQQQLNEANEVEPYDDGLTADELNREYLDHEREFSELMDATRWQVFDNITCTRPTEITS